MPTRPPLPPSSARSSLQVAARALLHDLPRTWRWVCIWRYLASPKLLQVLVLKEESIKASAHFSDSVAAPYVLQKSSTLCILGVSSSMDINLEISQSNSSEFHPYLDFLCNLRFHGLLMADPMEGAGVPGADYLFPGQARVCEGTLLGGVWLDRPTRRAGRLGEDPHRLEEVLASVLRPAQHALLVEDPTPSLYIGNRVFQQVRVREYIPASPQVHTLYHTTG